jgi:lipopolysaccharide transport system ATP-binding protein
VSFDVRYGERVGIVGRNGAGKSTLLKILSRVVYPTAGEARYRGRLVSLLEVGTGFHGDLTGRENVFLNGSIHGLSRAEIDARFSSIADFADMHDFLDTPVKRYSRGMHARLAFAVAVHLDPDILILDEVLSVGDADFQQKCLERVQALVSAGRTLLFVSHSTSALRAFCDRCIWLDNGRVQADGPIEQVLAAFHHSRRTAPADAQATESILPAVQAR